MSVEKRRGCGMGRCIDCGVSTDSSKSPAEHTGRKPRGGSRMAAGNVRRRTDNSFITHGSRIGGALWRK